jgi:hypothetical protein
MNQITWPQSKLTAANTAKDGTGTVATVLSATAGDVFLQKLIFRSAGTNVATVARVFVNNGGPTAVASNNVLLREITLDATTLTEVAAQTNEDLELLIMVPRGYRITVALGSAVSAGWYVAALSGDHYRALYTL